MPTFEQIQEEISNMLDIPDEELSEDQRRAMDEYLDQLGCEEAAKIDGFAQFIKLEAERAEACKAEATRLAKKAKSAEGRIAFLKNKYLEIMTVHKLKKIQGNAY